MGRYADKLKYNQQMSAIDTLLNGVTENDKIESLKEVLNLLSATDDGSTKLLDVINAAATAAITAAIGTGGAVTNAIDAKITAAIGTGGAIETWADGRYEPKSE